MIIYITGLYVFACWHNRHHPPTITNSISFDAKIKFLHDNRQRLSDARTIAIGSSICLNNIDSDYLENNLKGQSPFLNIAAWGLQVGEVRQLFHFVRAFNPHIRKILYITQLTDFRQDKRERIFDSTDVGAYIRDRNGLFFPFRYFNAKTIKQNIKTSAHKNSTHEYSSLLFGRTGSVLLDIHGRDRNQIRWDEYGADIQIAPQSYQELRSFCNEVREKKIDFYCVITPARGHFREKESSRRRLTQYKDNVNRIIHECGGIYIDADAGMRLTEDDFADTLHLNGSGATKVAEHLLPLLKETL